MAKSPSRARDDNQAGPRSGLDQRRAGLRALGANLPKIARRALGRRGFSDAGLIADWQNVVGTTIARCSQPLRLTFARAKERRDGTLLLRVAPGFALELQHLEPQLLERINSHFGYSAVAKLKFQQGPLTGIARLRPRRPRPLAPALESKLNDRLAAVEDESLRLCLERLGRSFHGKTTE